MVSSIMFASLLAATAFAQSDDGGYGSVCQPSVPTATKCSSGFTCILTEAIPGGKGFCHQLANEGETCGGGSVAYPAICNPGLSCVEPKPVAGTIQSGTCQAVTVTTSAAVSQATEVGPATGGYGDECQPSVPTAIRCGADFTCIPTTPNLPGGKGFCHAVSKAGGFCGGGSIQFPAVCGDGLSCVLPTGAPGTIEQGVCQAGSDNGSKTSTSSAAAVTSSSQAATSAAAASTKAVTSTNIKSGAGAVAVVTAAVAFVASLFAL